MISRRGLITGLVGLVAAPSLVRASSLMPISAPKLGVVLGDCFINTKTMKLWVHVHTKGDQWRGEWQECALNSSLPQDVASYTHLAGPGDHTLYASGVDPAEHFKHWDIRKAV